MRGLSAANMAAGMSPRTALHGCIKHTEGGSKDGCARMHARALSAARAASSCCARPAARSSAACAAACALRSAASASACRCLAAADAASARCAAAARSSASSASAASRSRCSCSARFCGGRAAAQAFPYMMLTPHCTHAHELPQRCMLDEQCMHVGNTSSWSGISWRLIPRLASD